MNHDEIIKRLKAPFTFKEIEWKIQVTNQDKTSGMAVAYLDARAVQKRLDEIVGPFNWKNLYSLWHTNSQICGISILDAERNEWVTKFDGAENSDIEPIKGGLSDSFKRAANMWGIGRYLYELSPIWVNIEPKGKSSVIRQDQYVKLEAEYNAVVARVFGTAPKQQNSSPEQAPAPKTTNNTPQNKIPAYDYKVQSVKQSGQSKVLELVSRTGDVVTAYIKASDNSIKEGSHLAGVQLDKRRSPHGEYNLISDYQLAA